MAAELAAAAELAGGYSPGDGMSDAATAEAAARCLWLVRSLVARGLARDAAAGEDASWAVADPAAEAEAEAAAAAAGGKGGKKKAPAKKKDAGRDDEAEAPAEPPRRVASLVRSAADPAAAAAGPSALEWASLLRQRCPVQRFLECVADVDAAMESPLAAAARAEAGPLVRPGWRAALVTALHVAAEAGRGDVASLLLAAGADANARDSRGRVAAASALDCGHAPVAAALLAWGTDLRAADAAGDPLLKHAACAPGPSELRAVSRVAEARPAAGGGAGPGAFGGAALAAAAGLPLPRAAEAGGRAGAPLLRDVDPTAGLARGIAAAGARPAGAAGKAEEEAAAAAAAAAEAAGDGVAASRIQAAARGRASRARAAAVAAASAACGRPLERWAPASSADAFASLLAAGADPGQADAKGLSALHWAAGAASIRSRSGSVRTRLASTEDEAAVCRALAAAVEAGADLAAADGTGRTALCTALYHGHPFAALALLGAGADPCLADRGGATALHYACLGRGWGPTRGSAVVPLHPGAARAPAGGSAAAAAVAAAERMAVAAAAGAPLAVRDAAGMGAQRRGFAFGPGAADDDAGTPGAPGTDGETSPAAAAAARSVRAWAEAGPPGLVRALMARGVGRRVRSARSAAAVAPGAASASSALAPAPARAREALRARLGASLAAGASPSALDAAPATASSLANQPSRDGVRPVHVLAGAGLRGGALAAVGAGGRGHAPTGAVRGGFRRADGTRDLVWPVLPAAGGAVTEATTYLSMCRAAEEAEARTDILRDLAGRGADVLDGAGRAAWGLTAAQCWAAGLFAPVDAAAPVQAFGSGREGAAGPAAAAGTGGADASDSGGDADSLDGGGSPGGGRDAAITPGRIRAGRVRPGASSPGFGGPARGPPGDAGPIPGGDAGAWPPRVPAAAVGAAAVEAALRDAGPSQRYLAASRALLAELVKCAGSAAEAGGCDSQSLAGSGGRRHGAVQTALETAGASTGEGGAPRRAADAVAGIRDREFAAWALLAAGVPAAPPTCNPPPLHAAVAAGVSARLAECVVSAAAAEAERAEEEAAEAAAARGRASDAMALEGGDPAAILAAAASPASSRLSRPGSGGARRQRLRWADPDARGSAGSAGRGERRHAGTALQAAAEAGHEHLVRWLLETAPRAAPEGSDAPPSGLDAGSSVTSSGPFLPSPARAAAAAAAAPVTAAAAPPGSAVDVGARRPHTGRTALHLAAYNGHDAVVRLLLRAGAPVEQADAAGENAVSSAVRGNSAAAVRALLLSGPSAPVSAVLRRAPGGVSALELAERVNVRAWTEAGGDAREVEAEAEHEPVSPVPRPRDGAATALLRDFESDPIGGVSSPGEIVAAAGRGSAAEAALASDEVLLTLLRVAAMGGGAPEDEHVHPCFRDGLTYGERAAAASGGMARVKRLRAAVLRGGEVLPASPAAGGGVSFAV